jgi:hypothetical protein
MIGRKEMNYNKYIIVPLSQTKPSSVHKSRLCIQDNGDRVAHWWDQFFRMCSP